ncbi:bifunctional adenosylcobinamide kinase/adenosylcobinamide-phosphate guanylyltransferase [Lactobacillus mellis]|nr:bifunctional adenosylcobinamide kinase/adenosylcobinamide-phosphate guanylyltransferase [Bombilactobacillus mellis]
MQQGNLILVLGGAKSGKSEFAEKLYAPQDNICYIATGVLQRSDPEMKLRIIKHQQRRPSHWQTREQYQNIAQLISQEPRTGYILDDVTMAVTNVFYDLLKNKVKAEQIDDYLDSLSITDLNQLKSSILSQWQQLIEAQKLQHQSLVIVSNEVGLGIVPITKQTRVLRDLYGEVNQVLAQAADIVYFVVSGIPLKIK